MEPTILDAIKNKGTGIPAPSMNKFECLSVDEGIKLTYACTNGASLNGADNLTSGNGYVAAVTKGVMIRYSPTRFPKNINDGELAIVDEDLFNVNATTADLEFKEKNYTVVGLTKDTTYYFTCFPYTNYNVYNESLGKMNCKTCQWTGTKGTLTVNVTQDFDYLPLGEYTVTLTPTAGGDAITKTQSGEGEVVFSSLEAGEYTLSFSDVENFIKPIDQKITITAGQPMTNDVVYQLKTNLSDYSWEEISNFSTSGVASKLFSVGDTIDITFGSETVTMEIVGFNHDDLTSGGKAGITFGMKHLMKDSQRMNETISDRISFVETTLYKDKLLSYYDNFPSDLKSVIKAVNKKTSKGNIYNSLQTDSLNIFLFSEVEVFGTSKMSISGEGNRYSRFVNSESLRKRFDNGSGDTINWWLRSPTKENKNVWGEVDSYKDAYTITYDSMTNGAGICFGFCV